MTWKLPFCAALALSLPFAAPLAHAQDALDPAAAARETPIIVERNRDDEPARAQLGSRIPQEPRFTDLNIATSTGINGLTPGAGLEPFHGLNRVSKKITTSCVSDHDAIGARAACLLLQASREREAGNLVAAGDIYRFLVSGADFGPAERLAGGTELYNLAVEAQDAGLREEALIRLVDSDALPDDRRPAARRNLVQMALDRGERRLAVVRLEEHLELSPDDAQSFANLAILRRMEGLEGAQSAMQSAIAINQRTGAAVPDGWRDFVRLAAPQQEQGHP